MNDKEEIRRIMKEYKTDELTAAFILAVNKGEIKGDVIGGDKNLDLDERKKDK